MNKVLTDDAARAVALAEDSAHSDHAEARMRLALGLQTEKQSPDPKQRPEQRRPASMHRAPEPGPSNRRHRFVQDGDVPVVLRHSPMSPAGYATRSPKPVNRVEAAEAAANAAQLARAKAERHLEEARRVVHDLRTRLGHAELARDEALAAARRYEERLVAAESARAETERARQAAEPALATERSAREAAEQELKKALTSPAPAQGRPASKKARKSPARSAGKAASRSAPKAASKTVRAAKKKLTPVRKPSAQRSVKTPSVQRPVQWWKAAGKPARRGASRSKRSGQR